MTDTVIPEDDPTPSSIASIDILESDGFYHVSCHTRGDSHDKATGIAMLVLNSLAGGKKAYIRVFPSESVSRTDYDTKITKYSSYARFSFSNEEGEWEIFDNYPESKQL